MELSVFLCVYLYIYGIFLITVFLYLFHFYKCKFFPPTGLILRSFHQKIKLFSIQQFYQMLGFPLSLPQTHIKDTSGIFINEKIIIDVGGEALPDRTQVHSHCSTFVLSCWLETLLVQDAEVRLVFQDMQIHPPRPDHCSPKDKTCPSTTVMVAKGICNLKTPNGLAKYI